MPPPASDFAPSALAYEPPPEGSRRSTFLALTLVVLLMVGAALALTYTPVLLNAMPKDQRLPLDSVETALGAPVLTDAPALRPPTEGWVPVDLPDAWATRWPEHDGAVWYRLRFTVPENWPHDVGLMLESITMAGAVWLDDALIWRDMSLQEPLSRAWNQPRYWLLGNASQGPARAGTHTLLVQARGHAAYQGGLGRVLVGQAAGVHEMYRNVRWSNVGLPQVRMGIQIAITLLFLMIWICWPRESLFGWYALSSAFWAAFTYNYVAASPWPLSTTAAWQLATMAVLWGFSASFSFFALRFVGLAWPRAEAALALSFPAIVGAAWAILEFGAPSMASQFRNLLMLGALVLYFVAALIIWRHAWSDHSVQSLALAITLFIPTVAGTRDVLVVLGLIDDNRYYAQGASVLFMFGISLLLAWRLRGAFEREVFFAEELRRQVERASARLTRALGRQRDMEVASARQTERLELVRDLHDGLGGTLTSAITQLQAPAGSPPRPSVDAPDTLNLLKQISNDLRLIIDSAGQEGPDELSVRLATLRRRLVTGLEARDITTEWSMEDLRQLSLKGSRALNILRILQEAVTNIVKHSQARTAQVRLSVTNGQLELQVRDDGQGFAPQSHERGAGFGLTSMHQRAAQLGGQLHLEAEPGRGTLLTLTVPLTAEELLGSLS